MRPAGKLRRAIRIALIVIVSVIAAGALATFGVIELRNGAAAAIGRWQRPDPATGIDRSGPVQIGGIPQWLSIRGKDRRNPVLLYLHGGPGEAMSGVAWTFASAFEDRFVVVHWDQRGAGKTYALNDPKAIAPTLTYDRMVSDAEEVVDYLRRELGRERIVVVGHSWGSVLGLELARRRPQWLYAYVGIGQVVNMRENERVSYERILAEAREKHDSAAIAELTALAPYPGATPQLQQVLIERKWVAKYGHLWYGRTDARALAIAQILSPDWSVRELLDSDRAAMFTFDRLQDALWKVDFRDTRFDVPIFLFEGRHDLNAPAELAAGYLDRIEAPQKKLVWFDTGHLVPLERPGEVLVQLVANVTPLCTPADSSSTKRAVR